jgi:hypothetical protein
MIAAAACVALAIVVMFYVFVSLPYLAQLQQAGR